MGVKFFLHKHPLFFRWLCSLVSLEPIFIIFRWGHRHDKAFLGVFLGVGIFIGFGQKLHVLGVFFKGTTL